MKSLGLVEVIGLTNAIFVADAMVKTANVEVGDVEITRGFGYVTVKVLGDVGAVNAAVSAGKSVAMDLNKLVSAKVIARPHGDTDKVFLIDEAKNKKPANKKVSSKNRAAKTKTTKTNGRKNVNSKAEVVNKKAEEPKKVEKIEQKVENIDNKKETKAVAKVSQNSNSQK